MPVSAIITQPTTNTLKACMRPIVFEVQTILTTPMVFCDVYINSVYYGTYEHTMWNQKTGADLTWQFDIRDKVQEYFQNVLPKINGGSVISQGGSCVRVFCKFRDSVYNNSLVVAQVVAPIQAIGQQPASPGDGLASNLFYVFYATQQYDDNANYETHLSAFKRGDWRADAYPLSHRPLKAYNVVPYTSDYYPFAVKNPTVWSKIRLHYRRTLGVLWQTLDYVYPAPVPECFAVITGITVVVDNVNRTSVVTVTIVGASNVVWSMPEIAGGNVQTPTTGSTFNISVLPVGTYTITVWPRCDNGVNGDPITKTFIITDRTLAWRGYANDAYCEQAAGVNTGVLIYQTLEQVFTDVTPNVATGTTKTNALGDPDYVAPIFNSTACPVPPPSGSGRAVLVQWSTLLTTICAATPATLYISPLYSDIQYGITVYTDAALTHPLNGAQYITTTYGLSFDINPATGIVGHQTGQQC